MIREGGSCPPRTCLQILSFLDIVVLVPDTWITDLTHFLEDGRLPAKLPAPARALANHLGSIVAAVTSADPDKPLGVRCRRRPGRRRCPGEIEAFIEPDSNEIHWMCLTCGDNGLISNWENTLWDCSSAETETHH
jgi:hypothetical protein